MTGTSTEPTPEVDQQSEEPQDGGPEPTEPPTDDREAPPSPESIGDAVDVGSVLVARVDTPAGSLTLRPNQKALDPEQKAALLAIGIDIATDPGVVPHLRAFVHMCQIRGLDPYAREAYLIGRGKGDFRKWTMQTGIDGYRKMAKSTGRFLRVKRTLWTGADDDDRSFRPVEEDGDYVMRRVWYDQWPADRGHPGAAKVVIEHLDETGSITTTDAVADWAMYAAYKDLYENRQKVIDPTTRKPVQVLNDMWEKGGPHMLAKCAEALAHRKAFPAAMSGIYVTEEMTRLDQDERNERQAAVSRARQEAFNASRGTVTAVQEPRAEQPAEESATEEPATAAEVTEEVVEEVQANAGEALAMLNAEFAWQAEVMGRTTSALANRWVTRFRKNLDAFEVTEMHQMVVGLRDMVTQAAHAGKHPQAEAYNVLVEGAADKPIDMSALVETLDVEAVDPDAPHTYSDDHGVCDVCGLIEDIGPHPEGQA